jgi:predicted transcriptional regulator
MHMSPAEHLASVRARLGLSSEQVAYLLGVSPAVVVGVEAGAPPPPEIERLLAVFPATASPVADDLLDTFADPAFASVRVPPAEILAVAHAGPHVSRALVSLYHSFRRVRDENEALRVAAKGAPDGVDELDEGAHTPAAEVTAFLQKHDNHFAELEEAAERLWSTRRLEPQNLYRGLVRTLMEGHGVLVRVVPAMPDGAMRRFDPDKGRLLLSEEMPPRTRDFQLACQVGLLGQREVLDRLTADATLTTTTGRTLARILLANYFAGAVMMPFAEFLASAKAFRYDIERLGHRYRSSFEQVCHRISTLAGSPDRESGAVPFHMVRVDIAGNISKRYSGSGIRFPRFAGSCPRWNVYRAFSTPGQIHVQISEMPDGARYFTVAGTVRKHQGGYLQRASLHAIEIGCRLEHARQLVYSEGVDLDAAPVPVGVACRLCSRTDCDQRAFPALDQPLQLDPNARARSVYRPSDP